MRKNRVFRVVKMVFFGIVAVTVVGFVVMGLWNVLMPAIFAVHTISFWQAIGLFLLGKILLGGFGRPHFGGGPHMRRHMLERWERMTPEEREKFKLGIRRGCGFGHEREASERQTQAQA